MLQQPFKKYDIVQIMLILLWSILAVVDVFIHHLQQNALFDFAFSGIIGLYWLYSGIKKVRESKAIQEPVRWYTQPSLLLGIAALITALNQLLQAIMPYAYAMYPHLEDVFSSIILIFLLAAICFYARDWWLRRKSTAQQ